MIRVFGSVNLDLVATVACLPRPGETRAALGFRATPGGKGANQALAARRAGADVALYAAVGRDAFAAPALALLRDAGVNVRGVAAVDAPTGIALIHVDTAGENTITVIPGANEHARQSAIPDDALAPDTTVLLQLEVALAEVEPLAARARRCGARVVLNASPALPLPRTLLETVDVLIVNEHEARALAGTLDLPAGAAAFASSLASQGRIVVVTLGAAGAIAHGPDGPFATASPTVAARDTVGAGDAFAGALAAALDRGAAPTAALRFAAAAGAIACTRHGAQEAMPFRSEIDAMLDGMA